MHLAFEYLSMRTQSEHPAVPTSLGVNEGIVYIYKRNIATDKYDLSGNLTAQLPPVDRYFSSFGGSLAFSKEKVRLIPGTPFMTHNFDFS